MWIPASTPVIGQIMVHMRTAHRKGQPHTIAYRAEFDAAFPGEFWPSHGAYQWNVVLYPLFAAFYAEHGHMRIPTSTPVIGNVMKHMRRAHRKGKPYTSRYRAEFDAAFPGEFWPSRKAFLASRK